MVFNYDDAVSDKIADGCRLFQTLVQRRARRVGQTLVCPPSFHATDRLKSVPLNEGREDLRGAAGGAVPAHRLSRATEARMKSATPTTNFSPALPNRK